YTCSDLDGETRCMPDSASCTCATATIGQTRACTISNATGTCFGLESCGQAGWSGCSADTPGPESCNGLDDNCNGVVDEGSAPPLEPCQQANAFGTCSGVWTCEVSWFCNALPPAEETCDTIDNDCNGVVDDPFIVDGSTVHDQHCGACGLSCDNAIPNATATCVQNGSSPRCEVAACDDGFYQSGPLACLTPDDGVCSPCQADANCPNPGDACLPLDGGMFCGRDCGEGNVYGTPTGFCPDGFACVAADASMQDASMQCQPVSKSCTCLDPNDGQQRTCVAQNDDGLCFGQQTCDPSLGWSDCTAPVPAVEICNDLDDDCNSAIDDVQGRGDACALDSAFGSCPGVMDCAAGIDALQCVGPTPTEDLCDYADNDCDDEIDEDYPSLYVSCSVGAGICQRFGFEECTADALATECNVTAGEEGVETCNGLDDDCDGQVDEDFDGLNTVCTVGTGACAATGLVICQADGSATQCSVEPLSAEAELCNGLDDDCDGQIDEDIANAPLCTSQEGVCAQSIRGCGGAAGWIACQAPQFGDSYQADELTCDALDNDCDGQTDEALNPPPCALQKGVCFGAFATCLGADGFGACDEAQYGDEYQLDEVACDGADNDCDGLVDEPYPALGQVCIVGEGACQAAGTIVCNDAKTGTQCSAQANTDAVELCNGVDDDCDGVVDENPSDGQACTAQLGVCADSQRACVAGAYQACGASDFGTGFEVNEQTCDGADNDCDGATDEALTPPQCPKQLGLCAGSTSVCDGAAGWTVCQGTDGYGLDFQEVEDRCDGLDNDCDGLVDEGFGTLGQVCFEGVGGCQAAGTVVCTGQGDATECSAQPGDQAPELCNGADDNCDGTVDNLLTDPQDCAQQLGVCAGSTQPCVSGGYSSCDAASFGVNFQANEFTCDGFDNDCDGDTDEALQAPPCALQKGVCAGTLQPCGGPSGWLACDASVYGVGYEADEIACDGEDNDCDGLVDEGFGTGEVCSVGVGACQASGTVVCNTAGTGTQCSATIGDQSDELCNGVDDDCDGIVDNALTDPQSCTAQLGVCSGSIKVCIAGAYQACDASQFGANYESTEFTCDALDNDCDGNTDANLQAPPCALQQGVCSGSLQTCGGAGGWLACGAAVYGGDYEADEATCDTLDNDCDGLVDENFSTGSICVEGQGACQVTGTVICNNQGDGTRCSESEEAPAAETCNGVDDNCDGSVDNQLTDTQSCTLQAGVCAGATRDCISGSYQGCDASNFGASYEAVEISCDALDNDCDGTTDTGLPTQPCANQQGVCAGSTAPCAGAAGFQACGAAEFGASFQATESVCDAQDNDCDGTTDEGFLNGATGKYDQDDACGSCFTDCTTIYDLPGAFGICDASATPTCVLSCDTGFHNLNQIPNDGCEFPLDPDAIYVGVDSTDAADDVDCGVGPAGTGGNNHPCATIAGGLVRAVAGSKLRIIVADGLYVESVTVVDGIDLLGGYRADTWERHVTTSLTTLRGTATLGTDHAVTVLAQNITTATTVQGFVIEGQNNATPGGNSYAVYISDSATTLTLADNLIYAGNGGGGTNLAASANGVSGTNGDGRNTSADPTAEYDALVIAESPCTAGNDRDTNNGGILTCGASDNVRGGHGGGNSCAPVWGTATSAAAGEKGRNGAGPQGGVGGTGGNAGQDGEMDGPCFLPPEPMTGTDGANGQDGAAGDAGVGCTEPAGVLTNGHWVGKEGTAGTDGGNGGGGGGGGAGGGGQCTSGCSGDDRLGGHGGGGGAGGCTGVGGLAAKAGGGSFGVFIVGTAAPALDNNSVFRGGGGGGGAGGNGGNGGPGGAGGNGGECAGSCWCHKSAGKGGEGGRGGDGGGAGAGCGGNSYGIFTSGIGAPAYCGNNTVTEGASGQGGAGGLSGTNPGSPGTDGLLIDCSEN
ncbi:MAG: hypothetical protein ACI9WU_002210, partial [Myxococcota bacterium]